LNHFTVPVMRAMVPYPLPFGARTVVLIARAVRDETFAAEDRTI
jgi:hypothetical protein